MKLALHKHQYTVRILIVCIIKNYKNSLFEFKSLLKIQLRTEVKIYINSQIISIISIIIIYPGNSRVDHCYSKNYSMISGQNNNDYLFSNKFLYHIQTEKCTPITSNNNNNHNEKKANETSTRYYPITVLL